MRALYLLRFSGLPRQKMLIYLVLLESSIDVQVKRGHFFPAIWLWLSFLDVFPLGNNEMVLWIFGHF